MRIVFFIWLDQNVLYMDGDMELIKPKGITLFSSGIDSLACLMWAREQYSASVEALYVDLNTKYARDEIAAAHWLTKRLGVDIHEVSMPWLGKLEDRMGHIPMRNIFLLETAALYSDNIVFGMLEGELSEDKGPEFVRLMHQLFDSQTRPNFYHDGKRITIHTPFAKYTKTQVVSWLLTRGCSKEMLRNTIGCLSGTVCGQCISCFNRWVAFENNGLYEIDDYEDFEHPALWGIQRINKKNAYEGKNFSLYSMHLHPWKKRHGIREIYKAYKNAYQRGLVSQSPLEILRHAIFTDQSKEASKLAG